MIIIFIGFEQLYRSKPLFYNCWNYRKSAKTSFTSSETAGRSVSAGGPHQPNNAVYLRVYKRQSREWRLFLTFGVGIPIVAKPTPHTSLSSSSIYLLRLRFCFPRNPNDASHQQPIQSGGSSCGLHLLFPFLRFAPTLPLSNPDSGSRASASP